MPQRSTPPARPAEDIFWCPQQERLEISWTATLKYPCRLIIYGWERGLQWHTELETEVYQPDPFTEPGINLVTPSEQGPLRQWQLTIPRELREALQPFTLWQLSLLQLSHAWREMRDLLRSNPSLVWLAMDFMKSQGLSFDRFRELLALKQHELLAAIGLTGTRSSARMLRRLELGRYDLPTSRLVRTIWSQPELIARLCHQQTIARPLMRLLKQLPWAAGRPLARIFDEIECSWRAQELIRLITDSCGMAVADLALRERLANARSFDAVEAIHNQLVDDMNNQRGARRRGIFTDEWYENALSQPFPAPPHPGTALIKPVCTPAALREEGAQMRHCVFSYHTQVRRGRYFVYHIESPGPATIGVRVWRGEILGVDQIKGARNRRVSPQVEALVSEWVQAARRGGGGSHAPVGGR